jgi:hypothetical protein
VADEAVLRIIIQDGGGGQPPAAVAPTAPPPSYQTQSYTQTQPTSRPSAYGYKQPKTEQPFDPVAEADKRRDSEKRKAQVDAAYKEEYGDNNQKSQLDDIFKIADSLRGTIGGIAGPFVGGMVDLASTLHKWLNPEQQPKNELLEELKRNTVATVEVRDAVKTAVKPQPPVKEIEAASEEPPVPEVIKPPEPVITPPPSTVPFVPEPVKPEEQTLGTDEFDTAEIDLPKPEPPPAEPVKFAHYDPTEYRQPLTELPEPLDFIEYKKKRKERGSRHRLRRTYNLADVTQPDDIYHESAASTEQPEVFNVLPPQRIEKPWAMPDLDIGQKASPFWLDPLSQRPQQAQPSSMGQPPAPSAPEGAFTRQRYGAEFTRVIDPLKSGRQIPATMQAAEIVPETGAAIGTEAAAGGGALASIAAAAAPIAAVAAAAGTAVVAFKLLTSELDRTADKYEQYSPQISQAKAMQEITNTLGDIRRSRDISPNMTQYIQAQTDLQQKYEDIKVKLLEKLLPTVTAILEAINMAIPPGSADAIATTIALLVNPIGTVAEAASGIFGLQAKNADKDMDEKDSPVSKLIENLISVPDGFGNQAK